MVRTRLAVPGGTEGDEVSRDVPQVVLGKLGVGALRWRGGI